MPLSIEVTQHGLCLTKPIVKAYDSCNPCCVVVVLVLLQVAGARAERDTLADQNAALARTTHQLMAGTAAPGSGAYGSSGIGSISGDGVGGGNGSAPAGPSASAPVSLNGAAADTSAQGLQRQRALSDPSAVTAEGGAGGPSPAAAGGGASAAAARITSGQLRDIGAMLARLTRENAALIKQRDKLEATAAEASRAAAAAEAAAAEKQSLLQERVTARAELEAARADYSRAAASVKQLTAERDRLLQQVRLHILLILTGRSAHYRFSAAVPEFHSGKPTQLCPRVS